MTLQIRRTRRHGHKFAADYERCRFYVDHPLNFQRLNKVGADLLVGQQLPTDEFDDPAYRLNVGRGLKVEVPTGRNFPTTCGPVTSPPMT